MVENKLFSFIAKHWFKALLGLLAIACVGIWAERFFKTKGHHTKNDFITAHQIFERFERGEPLESETLITAEGILKRHPELHPKYDPLLALLLLAQRNEKQAITYAHQVIERVSNQLPILYQKYAQTSLLITQERYSDAWKEAQSLDTQLQGLPEYAMLDAMNTLRLLFLAKKLQYDGASYWKKLSSHPHFLAIDALFKEGDLSLANYLKK